jgi:hypothetical protein
MDQYLGYLDQREKDEAVYEGWKRGKEAEMNEELMEAQLQKMTAAEMMKMHAERTLLPSEVGKIRQGYHQQRSLSRETETKRTPLSPLRNLNLPMLQDIIKTTDRSLLIKHARTFNLYGSDFLTDEERMVHLKRVLTLEKIFRKHKLNDP